MTKINEGVNKPNERGTRSSKMEGGQMPPIQVHRLPEMKVTFFQGSVPRHAIRLPKSAYVWKQVGIVLIIRDGDCHEEED